MTVDQSAADTPEKQLHVACGELRRRLYAGEPCRAEHLLADFPALAAHDELAQTLAYTEFVLRQELGERPEPGEWYARFPQWRDRLRQQLTDLVTRGQPTPPVSATTPGSPSAPGPERTASSGGLPERYELLERVGAGGMGVVYRVQDRLLGRVVALKMIRGAGLATPEEVLRFRREAQAVARLRHRHIIPLYDLGEHDDQPFLTMAYAPGGSLARLRDAGPAEPRAAAAAVEKVARAVQVAHALGIVHRDLKPSNVLLDEEGEPLVTDFGLAKFLDADAEATYTGQLLGTPAYMAPEQAAGHANRATPASDVWALGVILYELLTGRRPFLGSGSELADQVRTAEPPRPRSLRAGLDAALETVVLKCLQKEPGRRYATAGDLADDLGRWLRGEGIQARPESLARRLGRGLRRRAAWAAPAALLLLLAVALGGWAAVRFRVPPTAGGSQQTDLSPQAEAQAALEHALDAGQPVTLVGDKGPPRYHRWRTEKQRPPLAPQGSGPLFLPYCSTALLDLVPDPRTEGYRLSAEVMIEKSDECVAGLYCLAEERARPEGPEQYFVALSFAENGAKGKAQRAGLQVIRYREADPERANNTQELALGGVRLGAGPWHALSVEVRGNEIAATCDGKDLPRANLAQESPLILQWWQAQGRGVEAAPAFFPRSPLGLFVSHGTADFRNVVVTPLDVTQSR
jgi:predicted Ser/Thr protein kinase